jgi:pilus assembly protein FimV
MIKNKCFEIVLGMSFCLSPAAYSAGVGDIAYCPPGASPVVAQIPIFDVDSLSESAVSARLASDADLALTGMQHSEEVRNLSIITDYTSTLTPVIRISGCHQGGGQKLNFLLDFSWAQGRLLREYSIDVQNSEPVGLEYLASEAASEPERVSYQPRNELPTSRDSLPATSSSAVESTANNTDYTVNDNSLEAGSYYLVKTGESIWGIATRLVSNNTVNQRIDEIIALNPRSFLGMNPDRLLANSILKMP